MLAHRLDGPVHPPAGSSGGSPGHSSGQLEAGTVLLLNGGFMSAPAWEPVASLLVERHRVLRCDFRGQLRTPGAPRRTLEENARDVAELLEHLDGDPDGGAAAGPGTGRSVRPGPHERSGSSPEGGDRSGAGGAPPRVHVLGTSFGGLVGLVLAARWPERVASLVAVTVADHATEAMDAGTREMRRVIAALLGDGPGEPPEGSADRGVFHDRLVPDVYSAAYVAANAALLAERRRQVAALPDDWFRSADGILAALEGFDLRPELGAIRCPTLVVVAGDDRVTVPERGWAVARAIPGAAVAEHPTSGHVLVHEAPEWLVEQATEFWGERARTGGSAGAGGPEGRSAAHAAREVPP